MSVMKDTCLGYSVVKVILSVRRMVSGMEM